MKGPLLGYTPAGNIMRNTLHALDRLERFWRYFNHQALWSDANDYIHITEYNCSLSLTDMPINVESI